MTLIEDEGLSSGSLYSIRKTENRGRAVFASQWLPAGRTVHVASHPFVSIVKETFRKEVCAWCFKYQYGKNCSVKHPETLSGVCFCSNDCLYYWIRADFDGKLATALASLRTNRARKVFPNQPSQLKF